MSEITQMHVISKDEGGKAVPRADLDERGAAPRSRLAPRGAALGRPGLLIEIEAIAVCPPGAAIAR